MLDRLGRQSDATADPALAALLRELRDYPAPPSDAGAGASLDEYAGVVVPLRLATAHGLLTLFTTTTVFGMPGDVTLSELAVESFFPADPASAALLHEMAARRARSPAGGDKRGQKGLYSARKEALTTWFSPGIRGPKSFIRRSRSPAPCSSSSPSD